MPLQHLDLVAVGVGDEEELGHQRSVAMEFLDRIGIEAGLAEARVLAVDIIDADSEMAVARAMRIGFAAAVVDGELDLEIRFAVLQVDERETVELETVLDPEAEGLGIEIDRTSPRRGRGPSCVCDFAISCSLANSLCPARRPVVLAGYYAAACASCCKRPWSKSRAR